MAFGPHAGIRTGCITAITAGGRAITVKLEIKLCVPRRYFN